MFQHALSLGGGHLIRSSYVSHNGPLQLITPFHFIVPPALQMKRLSPAGEGKGAERRAHTK